MLITPAVVTVATVGSLLVYDTANPEEAVAVNAKVGSPTTLDAIAPNVMVWFVLVGEVTTNVCVAAVAGL
jgi:hypothetical protein